MASDINITFPNLEGRHLTLKFSNAADEEFILNFARMKILRYKERDDSKTRFPNMSGNHLTLKFYNNANEEFKLYYASMGILSRYE